MKKLPPKNVPGSLVDAEGPGDEVYFRVNWELLSNLAGLLSKMSAVVKFTW